ncbi:hypothetical protein [[Clostridium] hylemonae]|nr:hypothetical protein [[Clostridium] hylemonae]
MEKYVDKLETIIYNNSCVTAVQRNKSRKVTEKEYLRGVAQLG